MKIWHYYIPSEKCGGWGKFIIDSTGYFSCVTDYGNYAYQWTAHGLGDFREFLVSLDADYLMGKLGSRTEIDEDAIIRRVHETLLEKRKEGNWDRDMVREWWDAVESCATEREFEDFFTHTAVFKGEPVFEDWWEMFSRTYDGSLQGFSARLWPRFVEALKQDLTTSERVCKESLVLPK